jgi:hypothetical protein
MAELIRVADGAYPQPNYDFLPRTVLAWAGYVGGHTPHAWTAAEVAHLEATGRQWWGIWTAPVGRALNWSDAQIDAAGMIAGLERLRYSKDRPAFYDVEFSTWAAAPAQTEHAAAQWCQLMREAGYSRAYWYGPRDSPAQWRADWTGVPPAALPPGVVGIQYDHALSGDRYDISRFDPALFTPPGGNDMPLTDTDAQLIWSTEVHNPVSGGDQSAGDRLCAAQTDAHRAAAEAAAANDQATALQGELDAIKAELDAIKAALGGAPQLSGTFTLTGSGTVAAP